MAETKVHEDDEKVVYETTGDKWISRRVEWKSGTAQHNEAAIAEAITEALAELRALVAAPALPVVPDGTLTTAQLSNALRILRNEAQATRAGAQKVAATLAQTIRLVRGDFDGTD